MKPSFLIPLSPKTLSGLIFILAMTAGGALAADSKPTADDAKPVFRFGKMSHGKLNAKVTAAGIIEPETIIEVGVLVQGRIASLGADSADPTGKRSIDFGSPVEKGTVLAEIDPTTYKLQVDKKTASLKKAQANLRVLEAKRSQADQELRRAKTKTDVPDSDLQAFQGNAECAGAEAAVGQAAVAEAEADLKEAQANLDFCTIKSPIKGTVIDRRINVGQTVAANLSVPGLFLIAGDLMRLQVWAWVNETDIGHIHKHQDVTFTVDARPGQVFKGVVDEIRYNAAVAQNVVAYTVVVSTQNKAMDSPALSPTKVVTPSGRTVSSDEGELELLPYLTANLTFSVADRSDALVVPNAALRWRPLLDQIAPDYRDGYRQYLLERDRSPARPSETSPGDVLGLYPRIVKPADEAGIEGAAPFKPPSGGTLPTRGALIWIEEKGSVRPIKVVTGMSDDNSTEVVRVLGGDKLEEGTVVVTGADREDNSAKPSAPKIKNDK